MLHYRTRKNKHFICALARDQAHWSGIIMNKLRKFINRNATMHLDHPRNFTVISRRDLSLKSEFKQSNLPSFSTFIAYSGAGNKPKRPDHLPRLAIGLYLLTIN